MIERYAVVAGRITQELADLEQVVTRIERAMAMARQAVPDADLYLDSVALNLHDFYAGLERALHQVAALVDDSVPGGAEWHRELLRQMAIPLPNVRPQVLSAETVKALDEYLRFRHVVRNVYAFEFDPEQMDRLVQRLRPTFDRTRRDLEALIDFLTQLTQ